MDGIGETVKDMIVMWDL